MEKNSFMLLIALSKDTAAVGKAFLDRVKAKIDPAAAPLWIDSRGIGVFITTDFPAWRIWKEAFPETLSREEQLTLKDLLIVQVGPGWAAPPESRPAAWLNSRFPQK